MEVSHQDGEYLVRLARNSIEHYLENLSPPRPPKDIPLGLRKKMGVFCTLLKNPDMSLRGCIGLIAPDKGLVEALIEAACSAAQDPRFFPLQAHELESTIIEVTVLSPLEKISVFEPRDYLKHIKVGRDGLFLRRRNNCGVFLPQVPVEQKWSEKTYLCELCRKAGLDCDAWILKPISLYKFEGRIFAEREPGGDIYEKEMAESKRED
ncbi:MAG: TIGR00296 family protein [Candidatus Aenigmatarchaeota archaeon]